MGIMNGWEFVVLIVLAIIILGPQQLPEYAAKLARLVVRVRRMANDAKVQLKEQMGPEYDDLDWRQYDPRQYDPRRIIRDALLEDAPVPTVQAAAVGTAVAGALLVGLDGGDPGGGA